MDAGKLIQDILQAGERAKSVVPCYMGKPYTATTVNLMGNLNAQNSPQEALNAQGATIPQPEQ